MFDLLNTAATFLMATGKKIIAGPSKAEDEDYGGSDVLAGFIKRGAKSFLARDKMEIPEPPSIPEFGIYRQFVESNKPTGGATPVRQIGTNNSLFQSRIRGLSASINPDVQELLRQSSTPPTLQQGRRTLGLAQPTEKA